MKKLLAMLFTFYGGGGSGSAPATDPLGLTTSKGGGGLELGLPDPLALNAGSKEWNAAHQPAPATTNTSVNWTPEERAARGMLINRATQISQGQQGNYAALLGPSAATTAGQGMVLGGAGTQQQIANNAAGANAFGLSGAVLDPNNTPGYDAALKAAIRPIDNAFLDPNGVLSKIRGNAIGGNSGGQGTREGIANGIAGREYLNAIGDVSGKMSLAQYGQGLDFMGKNLAMAPGISSLQTQPGTTVAGVGQQQESYAQNQFNAPWLEMQPYINMLNSFQGGEGTTTTSTPPFNPAASAAQSNQQALGLAMMMAAMFS